jgi:hypothetical protein
MRCPRRSSFKPWLTDHQALPPALRGVDSDLAHAEQAASHVTPSPAIPVRSVLPARDRLPLESEHARRKMR